MNRILSWTLLVFLGIVLFPCHCRSRGTTDQTFAEACRLVSSAEEAGKRSYSEALGLYEKALGILEEIARESPSSPFARRVLTGYARVGPYTVKELKGRVLPFARLRASAEEDLLSCAMIFAERLESVSEKTQALTKLADAYLQAEQKEKVAGVLSKAFSAAKAIHDPSDRARVLIDIAAKTAEAGRYEEALDVVRAIDDPTWVPRALIKIAEHCAEAEQAEKAGEILTQALQASERIQDAGWQTSARFMIAATYAKAGLLDQALQLAEMAPRGMEKDRALQQIAVRLAMEEHCDRGLAIANTIQQGHPKAMALLAIAYKYIELDETERAEEVLSKALQAAKSIRGMYEIEKDVLIELIADLQAQAGQYDRALQIALPIEVHDRVWALLRIASRCAKAGLTDKACEIIPKAIEAAEERLLRYLCARVCARAGQVYAEAGQPEKARETLSRALRHAAQADTPSEEASVVGEIAELTVEAGLIGDAELSSQIFQAAEAIEDSAARATAFGLIAEQCNKGGAKEKVPELLSRALQAAEDIEEAEHRDGRMAWLASKYAEAGLYEQALHIARDTNDAQSKTQVLTEIAIIFSKSGREVDDGMRKILHEIVSTLPFPEVEKEASKLLAEAQDLIKLAQEAEQTSYADALELYQETLVRLKETATEVERNLIPRTQTRADSEQNPLLCALFIARKMEDDYSRDHALVTVAEKLGELGQYEDALSVTETLKNQYNKEEAVAHIAVCRSKSGDHDQALDLIKTIEDPYRRSLSLAEVAAHYADLGQTEKSSILFSEAVKVARMEDEPNDRDLALWRITGKMAEARLHDQAFEVAETIDEDFRKVYALAEIAAWCARNGESEKASDLFSEALRIARKMRRRDGKTSALAEIAQRLAESQDFDQAERVVKMMWLEVHGKALILADIAVEYWKAGQAEKASKALDQALSLAPRVRGAEQRVDALTDIAEKVGNAGQKEKACEILVGAIKAVDEAGDPLFDRASALGSIAGVYADVGQFDQALSIASSMGGAYERDSVLKDIAAGLARAGEFRESSRVVAMIGDPGDKACALAEVGVVSLKEKRRIDDQTRELLHAIIRELE